MNRKFLFLAIMTLLGSGLTAYLGIWQLQRAGQKEALAAHWRQQQARAPLTIDDLKRLQSVDATQLSGWHDRQIEVRGRWLAEHTLFLDNRQMESKQGFFVLTPLALETRDPEPPQFILVQRGWIPRHFLKRDLLPSIQTPSTTITFRGRLAASPSRLFEFKGADKGKIRQNTSIAELKNEMGLPLVPLMLVQTEPNIEGSDDPLMLRNYTNMSVGVEKHYGYAFQWFTLSALIAGLFAWFQVIRPARKSRQSNT